MNENKATPKSDARIAWGWAKWPAILGCLIGFNFSRDMFAKVAKPHSLMDETFLRVFFMAYFAVIAGGVVFCTAFVILKAIRKIKTLKQQNE